MKMQDYQCRHCGYEMELLKRGLETDPRLRMCPSCHGLGTIEDRPYGELSLGPFVEIVKHTAHVISDDVPGGFVIENLDAKPRRFYSKSEYRTELAARGLTTAEGNQWRGNPGEGSDKPVNGNSRWF